MAPFCLVLDETGQSFFIFGFLRVTRRSDYPADAVVILRKQISQGGFAMLPDHRTVVHYVVNSTIQPRELHHSEGRNRRNPIVMQAHRTHAP